MTVGALKGANPQGPTEWLGRWIGLRNRWLSARKRVQKEVQKTAEKQSLLRSLVGKTVSFCAGQLGE